MKRVISVLLAMLLVTALWFGTLSEGALPQPEHPSEAGGKAVAAVDDDEDIGDEDSDDEDVDGEDSGDEDLDDEDSDTTEAEDEDEAEGEDDEDGEDDWEDDEDDEDDWEDDEDDWEDDEDDWEDDEDDEDDWEDDEDDWEDDEDDEDADGDVKATAKPTAKTTAKATAKATAKPTSKATAKPTSKATAKPTAKATAKPTSKATAKPAAKATAKPTAKATAKPTAKATAKPTAKPTAKATAKPTVKPTAKPVSLKAQKKAGKLKLSVSDQTYTGKALKPAVKVKLSGKKLKLNKDYTVTYKDNKAIGTATATIKGKGKYNGSVKVTFRIDPAKVSGLKLKAGKKKLTVTWTALKGVTGYEIEYSQNKSFKNSRTVTVKKAATVKKVIDKLKAGKTWYVRIRAYKTVKKVKYWSAWSGAKNAKVK